MASGGDCAGNGADVRHLRIETKQAGIRGRADARRPHGKARLSRIGWVALAGLILAACSTSAPPGQNGKEYFSQKVYGKASPRRVAAGKPVPKGGGRYTVGRPYRVAGKTYIPSDNPRYSAIGLASWYGAAFHGRQTANGEIYDMNDLTAAHPTLPLPSYVRVTNLANGRSVVVRVNDRGPFARGRIIDVSKTAAGMLGFERRGTARVKVDYVGRANLDGHDRNMLMASYSQGGKRSSNGLFNAPSRGSFQIAAAAPVPRLRSSHAAGLALRPVTATGNPLVLVPAFALRPLAQPDLLAPVILSGGYVTSFAPVNPVRRRLPCCRQSGRRRCSTRGVPIRHHHPARRVCRSRQRQPDRGCISQFRQRRDDRQSQKRHLTQNRPPHHQSTHFRRCRHRCRGENRTCGRFRGCALTPLAGLALI